MSIIQTGVKAHDDTCRTAEMVRTIAIAAAGNSQSAARSADTVFHKAVLKSAIANGCDPTGAMTALRDLGAGFGL